MNLHSLRTVMPGVLLLGVAVCLQSEILYTVTDLGTLGGSYSDAFGINNLGQVTGTSDTAGNAGRHAYLYSDGHMTDLETLGSSFSRGADINDRGEVTGFSATPTGGHAFLYREGKMMDLGTLGGSGSTGSGINNQSQVTGPASTSTGETHAFLYSDGKMMDLGTLGGPDTVGARGSDGFDINNQGEVTGWSTTSTGALHAFLYSNGQMMDLGIGESQGLAINDVGEIVGRFGAGAFLYSNGQMTRLGSLVQGGYSEAWGINNRSQIVGWSTTDEPSQTHAFIYSNGRMTDLNDVIDPALGIILSDARDINERGQIAANGISSSDPSSFHAYLLTPCGAPVISDVSATPNVLWPPNHGLVRVAIGYSVDEACPGKCELTVSSNEPIKGPADGTTSAAWRVFDAHEVGLRAERDGNGSGRVYTVTVTCVNNKSGQFSTKTVEVVVPHDQGQ